MKRLTLAAAAALTAAAAFSQIPVDRPTNEGALATLLARTVLDLDSLGLKVNRPQMLAMLSMALDGEKVGFADAGEAQGWIADALRPPAIAPADAAKENAWVARQIERPRTERLPGGTILQRLVEGAGSVAGPREVLKVMYVGRLSDGTVFDQTSEPIELPVDQVVPGLRTAFVNMRHGGRYRVFIPPAEGYGTRAIMDLIPANSALDFEISIEE